MNEIYGIVLDNSLNSLGSLISALCDIESSRDPKLIKFSKACKSKICLFSEESFKEYFKSLKLCVILPFEESGIFLRDSQYIRCIFGYYRSKYLRRVSYPNIRVTKFDLFVHNNFFTVNGGGI